MLEVLEDMRSTCRLEPETLEGLVRGVLPEVVARVRKRPPPEIPQDLLDRVCKAASHVRPEMLHKMVAELLAEGLTAIDLCDTVIPSAARRFGEQWLEDSASFAEVTIGVARLQSVLRDLEVDLLDERPQPASALQILFVVPRGCQHTLGALSATGLLRRDGHRVHLSLCEDPEDCLRQIAGHRFDLVLVTAAAACTFESIRETVSLIRNGLAQAVPIIVGGPALALHADLADQVGANLATSDIQEAIALVG